MLLYIHTYIHTYILYTLCRYTFGVESSFILLQPMYSFAIHDISSDTPHTNWECPVTQRDKIRVAYKANNRGYLIRDTVTYPAAHDIVKPLVEGAGDVVEWWKEPSMAAEEEEVLMDFLDNGGNRHSISGQKGEEEIMDEDDQKKMK